MTIQLASSLPVALRRHSLTSLVVALALSACGGGGGSDTTNPQPEPEPPPPPPPVTSEGSVSLLAGSAGGPGYVDGTGTNARFNGPRGLAVDAAGDL